MNKVLREEKKFLIGIHEFICKSNQLQKEHKKEKAELNNKLAAAEKELGEYKKAHGDIANALLEAQQYATSLKQKAAEENEGLAAENRRFSYKIFLYSEFAKCLLFSLLK